MHNGSTGMDPTDLLQSGVPLSETLPEEAFLSVQAGRLKVVMIALDEIAKVVHGPGPAAAYIAGLKDLLGAVRDDLEVLTKSKALR
ncbi:MAG: hypothetical protein SVK44_08935 [Nitrospirota bacterium]|nr:hypothetical protein [Nitrospirota bacterium]